MYLTINELCKELSLSRSTIYRLLDIGLPYEEVLSRKRFVLEDVCKWLQEQGQKEK